MYMFIGYSIKGCLYELINPIAFFVLFGVAYTIKLQFGIQNMVMSWSQYPSGFVIHFIISLIGIYSALFFALSLSRYGYNYIIEIIGKETKIIMSLHLLIFFCLDFIFYSFGFFDITKSNTMNHYSSNYVWCLYVILGTFAPVIIMCLFKSIFQDKYISEVKITINRLVCRK